MVADYWDSTRGIAEVKSLNKLYYEWSDYEFDLSCILFTWNNKSWTTIIFKSNVLTLSSRSKNSCETIKNRANSSEFHFVYEHEWNYFYHENVPNVGQLAYRQFDRYYYLYFISLDFSNESLVNNCIIILKSLQIQ